MQRCERGERSGMLQMGGESGSECEEKQSARKDSVELPAAMARKRRALKEEES
jgi:hypothetical protein